MKSIKTVALTTSVLTVAATVLSSAAFANYSHNNSEYIEDVTLSVEGINLNMIELQNTSSSKLLSKVNVQPVNTVMNIPVKGFVQCTKDKKVDFDKAIMYFGTAHRQGDKIVPVKAVYQKNYHPTFKVWTGLLGGWVAEAGNYDPFAVPLANIKNGDPTIRVDPVEEFNKKLEAHVNGGGTKLEFLQNDQFFSVTRPITLAGYCHKGADKKGGYVTKMIPINIKFKGDPNLTKPSPMPSASNKLAAKFALTKTKVSPHIKNYVGQCPVDLGFRLTFEAQGKGAVKYRMVNKVGAKGPINTVNFTNGGVKVIDFSKHISDPNTGSLGNLAIQNSQNSGNISKFKTTPSSKKHDSWKVEIVEPVKSISDESFYSWECKSREELKGTTKLKKAPQKAKLNKIQAVPLNPKPEPKPILKLKQAAN